MPHQNYCAPRVEVELAFTLGRELKGPSVGLTDVLRATEYVIPAIEIVHARLINPRKIFDTISDNGSGIVVGGRPKAGISGKGGTFPSERDWSGLRPRTCR